MRRALLALLVALVGVTTVSAPAATAQPPAGNSMRLCLPHWAPPTIGPPFQYWICYDIPLRIVTFPPDGCNCPWAIEFGLEAVLPPQMGNLVVDQLHVGLIYLGSAELASDPGQAAQYHEAAMDAFTLAAQLLGGAPMPAPMAGHVWSPSGPFIPAPGSGVQLAGELLTDGMTMLQGWLANQNPELWDLIVPMFDAAYDALATP